MSDNKDNAPKRIFKYMNHSGQMVESYSRPACCDFTKMDEYVLKSTADKRLKDSIDANKEILKELIDSHKTEIEQVMGDGAGVYINRQIKEIVEEILKPIRETWKKFDGVCKYSEPYVMMEIWGKIKETLKRNDKL